MELSPHRANGNDPFNLWQKHTGEEVPNARPVPWGGPLNVLSSPPAAAGQTAWFIDCCFTLILIHCSVYGDRWGRRTVALSAIQGQGWYRHPWKSNSWVGDDRDKDGWLAWGLVDPNAIVIYWKNGLWFMLQLHKMALNWMQFVL